MNAMRDNICGNLQARGASATPAEGNKVMKQPLFRRSVLAAVIALGTVLAACKEAGRDRTLLMKFEQADRL